MFCCWWVDESSRGRLVFNFMGVSDEKKRSSNIVVGVFAALLLDDDREGKSRILFSLCLRVGSRWESLIERSWRILTRDWLGINQPNVQSRVDETQFVFYRRVFWTSFIFFIPTLETLASGATLLAWMWRHHNTLKKSRQEMHDQNDSQQIVFITTSGLLLRTIRTINSAILSSREQQAHQ